MNLLKSVSIVLALIAAETDPCFGQQWTSRGFRLCQSGCYGDIPQVVTDGSGGAYVAWRDLHNSDDVFMQHVTALGSVAVGWPVESMPIVVLPSDQEFSSLAPDGQGGAFVAWEDNRNFPGTATDTYLQRVLADGSLAPGWAPMGNPASLAPVDQSQPRVAPDGVGGVYLAWRDNRDYSTTGFDAYGQHLTPSGTVAPGWPDGGRVLAAGPSTQAPGFVVPDDSGGVVFIWGDGSTGGFGGYALRVYPDGSPAAGWPSSGIHVANRVIAGAVRDGSGGFYMVIPTLGPSPGFDGAYYLYRYRFDGTPTAGWPAGGAPVCSAPGNRAGVRIDSDGVGGALLVWYDYRSIGAGEIYAARVLSSGTLAPGWTVNGTLVSDPNDQVQSYDPDVARDGIGGAYIVWQSQGACCGDPSTIQHLTGFGQPAAGWAQYGQRVAPSTGQFNTRITADGLGGAIVAWDENNGIWAQRYAPDGPTPVLVSLASAEVHDGAVALDWLFSAGNMRASVERRTENSAWLALGDILADGTGHLRFVDRGVIPATRYAYRLAWRDDSGLRFSAETWVEVPAPARFALEGLRPNPAIGDAIASFSLSSSSPAVLELVDVSGRRAAVREVGSLGAGPHMLRLGGGEEFRPGVYWLRLSQGGQAATVRAVIAR